MKLICLNVWNGGILWENMLDFLQQEQPDILVLQEVYQSLDTPEAVYERTIDALQMKIDLPYSVFAPAFLNVHAGKKIQKGNAVLSKFPLQQKNVIFFDHPFGEEDDAGEYGQDFTHLPRNLQHVEVQTGSTPLNVFNLQGIWGWDGLDNPRRKAMGEKILRAVQDLPHVILAGDFNINEPSELIQTMNQHLTNVFAGERVSSFNLPHKKHPGYATAVVDFIFVTPDIQVSSHSSPQIDISDHLPLIIEFEAPAYPDPLLVLFSGLP
ncbi:MAG: endonuclease/exonuclease/phosphatase family protein [Patescibacteria group bacterium]